jgi:hypothetical protein
VSASAATMHDFIETLRRHVPPVHPCGAEEIRWLFVEMCEAVDDPSRVVQLAARVRRRVVQELRWEAESAESARAWRDAYKLRRQADRFEAAHV